MITLSIAIVGLVVALASFGWQIYSQVSRVSLRAEYVAPPQYAGRIGFISATVRNKSGHTIHVKNIVLTPADSLQPTTGAYDDPDEPLPGPVEPRDSETATFGVGPISQRGFDLSSPVRVRVTLGTGKVLRSEALLIDSECLAALAELAAQRASKAAG